MNNIVVQDDRTGQETFMVAEAFRVESEEMTTRLAGAKS